MMKKVLSLALAFMLLGVLSAMPAHAEPILNVLIDSSSKTVSSGESVNYTVFVTNDGDEGTNVTIGVSGVPTDWIVTFNQSFFYLDVDETAYINMTVEAPVDAEEDDSADMEVYAVASRGSSDSTTFTTTVKELTFYCEWTVDYSTSPIYINSADVGTMGIHYENAIVGTVYTLRLLHAPPGGSLADYWICYNVVDPENSEIDTLSIDNALQTVYEWTATSTTGYLYCAISPLVTTQVGDAGKVRLYYKLSISVDYDLAEDPVAGVDELWEVDIADYHIYFQNVDSVPKEADAGGYVDYYFEVVNGGNASINVEYVIDLDPYISSIPDLTKIWGAQLGRYTTSGNPSSFVALGTPASTGIGLEDYGYYTDTSLPPGMVLARYVRVTAPANGDSTDEADTIITVTIAQSSKSRAIAQWYAGNELNSTENGTGVAPAVSGLSIWLIVGVVAVIIIAIAVTLFIRSKNKSKEFCDTPEGKKPEYDARCGRK